MVDGRQPLPWDYFRVARDDQNPDHPSSVVSAIAC